MNNIVQSVKDKLKYPLQNLLNSVILLIDFYIACMNSILLAKFKLIYNDKGGYIYGSY